MDMSVAFSLVCFSARVWLTFAQANFRKDPLISTSQGVGITDNVPPCPILALFKNVLSPLVTEDMSSSGHILSGKNTLEQNEPLCLVV